MPTTGSISHDKAALIQPTDLSMVSTSRDERAPHPRDEPVPFRHAAAGAVLLGALVRAAHVVTTDFPLNDGGLFYAMATELGKTGYHLPAFTTYNAAQIPFAYSPFAFYVAALTAQLTPLDLIGVFHWVPLIVACLTIIAVLALAVALLPSRTAALAATVAFGVVPHSFAWLIMGGGITRGFGLFFGILAVHQALALYRRRRLWYAATLGLCVGLTGLSHIGTVPFVLFSLVLFALALCRDRVGVIGTLLAAVVALATIGPWVATTVGLHGLAPFRSASGSGQSALTSAEALRDAIGELARLGATSSGEPFFPIVVGLALLGTVASLGRRQWLLPVWWVGTLALNLRGGQTFAAVPLALLAGLGVTAALLPLLRSAVPPQVGRPRRQRFATAVIAALVLYTAAAAVVRHPAIGGDTMLLTALTPAQRATMRWAATTTPPGSRFAIVPEIGWAADKTSEWFPVLAERVSVATPQGREWLPGTTFQRSVADHFALRDCGGQDGNCLDRWSRATGASFSYVLVPRSANGCCVALDRALRSDPRYLLVRDTVDGAVFAVR
jgi:hypothetical protein